MHKFGRYLTRKLKEKGLSQSQLAYYSGISDAHISRLSKEERGLPKIETLFKVSAALKISLKEMLKELGYLDPPIETLPQNLQTFLKSDLKPKDITTGETEMLASFSLSEGEATDSEGYLKILEEHRARPNVRIDRLLQNQTAKLQEACAMLVETYVTVFGDKYTDDDTPHRPPNPALP